jgi:serine/threonine protein kinase
MPINFENADPIGRGAQGKVYKVRIDKRYCGFSAQVGALNHPTFSKELALKVVRIRNQDQRERNFLEFLSTSQIMQHDHITRTYTGFEFNGNDYFISELAQTSLTSFMSDDANARAADVDLKWLRSQFIGLAEALARMHGPSLGQQAYHHDIKPDNILVFSPRILKLTDWGCAGFKPVPAGGGSQSTQKRGQFPHLPPEHVGINAATSRPHDVWSLACVFTEMLFWFYHGTQATQQLKKTTHALDDTGPPKRGCWFSNNPAPSDNNPPTLADRFKLAPTIDTALTNLGTMRPNMRSLEKILRKMFEIIPGERIKADVVVQELRNVPD